MPGCHPASLFPPRRPLWAVIGSGPEEEEEGPQLLEEGRRGRRRFDLIRGFRVAASAGAAYSVSRPYLMRRQRGPRSHNADIVEALLPTGGVGGVAPTQY